MRPGCLQSQLGVMGKGKAPFLLHGPSAPLLQAGQVDIPAVSWSGCFQEAVLLSFSPPIYPFCSALPLIAPSPPALLGVVRVLPALVGGLMWTLGHEGPPPPNTCSQSEQRHRASGEGEALPGWPSSLLTMPSHPLATAMRPRWLPAPQGVPASRVSGITHSHVSLWPAFPVGAA